MDKQKQIARYDGAMVDLLNQEMKELQASQKQIEEMTELMANWALRNNMCWHEGHAKALAETFVENDYGKITENEVVIAKNAKSLERKIAKGSD